MDIHDRLTALTTPARTRILRLLFQEELGVGEVSQITQSPQSTVSRHLKSLLDAKWVERRKVGSSTLFVGATQLSALDQQMWALIDQDIGARWEEDQIRLRATLRARTSSESFFGRVAHQWKDVRKDLYGEGSLIPFLLSLIPPRQTIADLGCGTGEVLALLLPHSHTLIGIDQEPAMIEACQTHLGDHPHLSIRQGDLENPPLQKNELDLALCNLVLHLIENPTLVFKALRPTLKPNGRLILLDMLSHDRTQYRHTMGHQHLGFSQQDLIRYTQEYGFKMDSYHILPPDPEATGPLLFISTFSLS